MTQAGSPQQLLDVPIELLKIGPVGGVDNTTAPHYVAPQNVTSSQNFTLNTSYGALTSTLGRTNALLSNLPGPVTGMFCLSTPGNANVYIFAVSNTTSGHGELWSSTLGGTPTQITLPTVPSTGGAYLTTGLQTYFCSLGQWVFMTNGTDTPLKINASLLVTQWGIVKPATAPTLANGGALGALTQNAPYYYCITFGNTTQESSQGAIAGPFTLTFTPATATTTLSGTSSAGDVLSVLFTVGGFKFTATTNPLAASLSASAGALVLAQAVNSLPSGSGITATVAAGAITFTSSVFFSASWVSQSTTSYTFTPTSGTFAGGTNENEITLTNIPVSTDTQVTQRNIYRLGGALGQWRLVHTIADNTTTSYTDTTADVNVTGQSLTIFRDPPAAFTFITTHQNRVWGFGTSTDSGALWFSNYNEPWGFNTNTNILECNSTTLDDGAVAMASLGSTMLCLKKRSAYIVYGNTDLTFQPYFAFWLGCTSPRSLASGFGYAWWESRQGIYFYNGGGFDHVGNNLSSGRFQTSNIKSFLDGLTVADRAASCGFVYDSMYHISFPTKAVTWFYDLRTQQWCSLSAYTNVAWYSFEDQIQLVASNPTITGEVDEWFQGGTDLGNNITATMTSRHADVGDPSAVKVATHVTVSCPVQTTAATCTVLLTLNPGVNQTIMAPLTFTLNAGQSSHIQDVALNEFFTLKAQVSFTSSVQLHVNSVTISGYVRRRLPESLMDGP